MASIDYFDGLILANIKRSIFDMWPVLTLKPSISKNQYQYDYDLRMDQFEYDPPLNPLTIEILILIYIDMWGVILVLILRECIILTMTRNGSA